MKSKQHCHQKSKMAMYGTYCRQTTTLVIAAELIGLNPVKPFFMLPLCNCFK